MRRSVEGFIKLVIIPALAAISINLCPASADCNPNLIIGFVAPFSGENKIYGESCKNGFELGLKSMGCSSSIKVFYEDDQFVPSKTVTAFRKLTELKKANVIITNSSPEGNALSPLSLAKKIPLFAWAADTKVTHNNPYALRSYPSGETEGAVIASEVKKRGYKKVALISGIDDYVLSVRNGLINNLDQNQVIHNEEVPEKTVDFLPLLTKIKLKQPDAIYLCSNLPGTMGIIAKQIRQLQIKAEVFGCYTLQFPINFETSEGSLAGSWFPADTVVEKFHADYLTEYHEEPGTIGGAAIHYDLARLIASTHSLPNLDFIKEISSNQSYEGAGLKGVKPVRTDDDRFLKMDLNIRRFDASGKAID